MQSWKAGKLSLKSPEMWGGHKARTLKAERLILEKLGFKPPGFQLP
jgi:hypothetical protein